MSEPTGQELIDQANATIAIVENQRNDALNQVVNLKVEQQRLHNIIQEQTSTIQQLIDRINADAKDAASMPISEVSREERRAARRNRH